MKTQAQHECYLTNMEEKTDVDIISHNSITNPGHDDYDNESYFNG